MRKDFVCLASASPRRRALLEQIGVRFEVRAAPVDEARMAGEAPAEYVRRLAAAKAEAVWQMPSIPRARAVVIAADTAVVLDDRLLGKPADRESALEMLAALSGRTHRVFTGVAVRHDGGAETLVDVSEVRFRSTTAPERRAYCATEEPFDKAGGYAIQGRGAVFVEHLSGSHSGVMGLPLCQTAELLRRVGVAAWWAAEERRAPA